MARQERKLDQAARAAWLYYVGGHTQDEIAVQLRVSRPSAQRLIALARDEGLVKVRIDYPVANCMRLAGELRCRYALSVCDVVPAHRDSLEATTRNLAVAGAARLESFVVRDEPTVLNLGTGRTLRAAVEAMTPLNRPQHRFVSVVGNVARDGSSNPFDAVMVLADKTGGRRFLLPAPLVADTVEERDQYLHQRVYRVVMDLAKNADATFVGIGSIGRDAQLFRDGFITESDLNELTDQEAVGEILGWPLDSGGAVLTSSVSKRLTSLPLQGAPERPIIAMAGGAAKARAIRAALQGGWLTGLVVDEAAAQEVLDGD